MSVARQVWTCVDEFIVAVITNPFIKAEIITALQLIKATLLQQIAVLRLELNRINLVSRFTDQYRQVIIAQTTRMFRDLELLPLSQFQQCKWLKALSDLITSDIIEPAKAGTREIDFCLSKVQSGAEEVEKKIARFQRMSNFIDVFINRIQELIP